MSQTRIVIVEDEGIVAKDLRNRLTALDYQVVGMASGGKEAIEKVGVTKPDLVLMDIQLADEVDGITAASVVRGRHDIPVIFLTAYADPATLQRAKITEPFGYILKPFEERELQTNIEMALHRHRYERALRRQNELLAALHQTTLGLVSHLDLAELMQAIIGRAAALVGTPHGYVFLQEPGSDTMEMRIGLGLYQALVGTRARKGVGLAGSVWQTGQPIVVDDYRSWPGRLPNPDRDVLRAVAGVPLTSSGQTVGVIGLAHTDETQRFGEAEMDALTRFAGLASVALDNARLYAALRESEAKHRVLLNSIQTPILALTSDFRVVYCNHAYARFLEKQPQDLEGKSLTSLYPEAAKLRTFAAYKQVLETGEPAETEGTMDGRILHSNVFPTPWGILSIAEDVTERRRAEEQRLAIERKLLETQKLESLGVLAGGIAHDFNNLLVSILGNVGLVLLDLDPTSPIREPVEQIKVASQRAADLTKQMLAYSGRGRFVTQKLNLNGVVQEMAQLLQVSISKNAVLRFNLAEHIPCVEADPTQVRQVVMNLILNASDAIGERPGVITLTTGSVHADQAYLATAFMSPELPAGTYVYLEVADTGIGMDAETQAKIFDPFFTTKFTGRGLGLAAVMGIVRGHKGAIRVYSEPGQGSVFRILLPSVESTADGSAPEKPAGERKGMGTVLVIDDEEVVRTVTKKMLERYGYTVLQAHDGKSGIETFRAGMGQIDCVLLDMTMPHMSGQETFLELRRIKPDLQVLLMSGYTEQEANSRFHGQGLAGFLQKPYTPQELNERIHKAISDGRSNGKAKS